MTKTPAEIADGLRHSLARNRTIDRQLDARIAVQLYCDNEHGDDRDNTYARLPSPSDECAEGTYWISSFSGLSLRTAPDFTGDKLLKQIALTALAHLEKQHDDSVAYVRAEAIEALEARVKALEGALKKSAEGWENAVELGLLPSQHTMSARILGQNARQALEDANK